MSDTPLTITYPILHPKGTSKEMLIPSYVAAYGALNMAIERLRAVAPVTQDYPIEGSFQKADCEHLARIQKLTDVATEILAIYRSLYRQS